MAVTFFKTWDCKTVKWPSLIKTCMSTVNDHKFTPGNLNSQFSRKWPQCNILIWCWRLFWPSFRYLTESQGSNGRKEAGLNFVKATLASCCLSLLLLKIAAVLLLKTFKTTICYALHNQGRYKSSINGKSVVQHLGKRPL